MSKKYILFFTISLILLINISEASDCRSECGSGSMPFPNKKTNLKLKKITGLEPDPSFFFVNPNKGGGEQTTQTKNIFKKVNPTSKFMETNNMPITSDVVINGKNYGKISRRGGLIWMNSDVPASPGMKFVPNGCPIGSRAPTYAELKAEYDRIISKGENIADFFTAGKFYISTEKAFPLNNVSQSNGAWKFKGLQAGNSNSGSKLVNVNTYADKANLACKCVIVNDLKSYEMADLNGKKVFIFNKVAWHGEDVKLQRGIKSLTGNCPKDTRLPTGDELMSLLTDAQVFNLIDTAGFNVQEKRYYASSTNTGNWEFTMLEIMDGTPVIRSINSVVHNDILYAKCIYNEIPKGSGSTPDNSNLPYLISNKNVILNGKDYGKLFKFRKRTTIWLEKPAKSIRSIKPLTTTCPAGYQGASMADYQELIDDKGISILGLVNGETYLSSNKKNPSDLSKGSLHAYEFNGISVNGNSASTTYKEVFYNQYKVLCIQSKAAKTDKFFYKSEDEAIIGGINYGNIIKIGKYFWLQKDLLTNKSTIALPDNCPAGFRMPNIAELLDLDNSVEFPQFGESGMRIESGINYISSTKSFPNEFSMGRNNAWKFKGINLAKGDKIVLDINSYFGLDNARVKCILDLDILKTNLLPLIQGFPEGGKDAFYMDTYHLKINLPNVIAIRWTFGNGKTSEEFKVDYKADTPWCSIMKIQVQLFEGSVVESCFSIWTIQKKRSSKSPSFQNSDIKSTSSLGSNVKKVLKLHFTSATAPLAPILTGGSYILYADKSSNKLKVVKLEADLTTSTTIDTGESGRPFDIVATPAGFAILYTEISNSNHLVLKGMSSNGAQIFKTTIMNNGEKPTSARNQLKFYSKANKLEFGMQAMFDPDNGKLVFGRGRIFALFAHYNNFDITGGHDDHTGDTLISFDDKSGRDEKLGFGWGCSHSLRQRLIYDGENVLSTSLGDAFPMNIQFQSYDGFKTTGRKDPHTGLVNRLKGEEKSSTVLDGYIVGNKIGQAAGRIGGLFEVSDQLYVSGFARGKGKFEQKIQNDKDEMGLIYFYKNLTSKEKINLGKGGNVNLLKGAMYGSNIMIGYATTTSQSWVGKPYLGDNVSKDDKMFMMMTDSQGNVLTRPSEVNHFSLLAGDDFENLSDGRVVWTYVEDNGDLKVYYLPAP